MDTKDKASLAVLFAVALVLILVILLAGKNFAVLNPKGLIAHKERNLMIFAALLSLVVVIPVYIMTFSIAWRYREGNKKAKYTPDWDHNAAVETVWWLVPLALITILSVVTWNSSHALDPARAFAASKQPITIQVVALQWKWLFIYPGQNIATVNFVEFPVDTPVNFEITADAPMNSFWIPQLGGQIYAMNGMSTQLHLEADTIGNYAGRSANISGSGFAGMQFTARASSEGEFNQWLAAVQQSPHTLYQDEYDELAKPSENIQPIFYSSVIPSLYASIVLNFVQPNTSAAGL